ncbi:uncharacterized protein LOC119610295 isoform X1 [Lucilia sericata]|uniref:uncharacterized protein LOC119610295 isoform X1 n=1 Tax=Lucilia sericata TaxID=13632 RepID=UPI0018A85606|nr:uncharacterized protein LOC119610295 isoform X1 [Lucilia sericata]
MSETLTSQELAALKDLPSAPEMGELRKITTLQDIPLAQGDSLKQSVNSQLELQAAHEDENEHKIKTNSLKRFFRLPSKKKSEGSALEGEASHMEFEEGGAIQYYQQNPTQNDHEDRDLKQTNSEYRRFKLNYGRYESNPASNVRPEKELSASFSKANLKSSLSTYWNSVFKLKKTKKSSKSQLELQQTVSEATTSRTERENQLPDSTNDLSQNPDCPADSNSILDDIHTLQISEESRPK